MLTGEGDISSGADDSTAIVEAFGHIAESIVDGERIASGVELVLEVAEHLLGGGVVDAVALPAHGLADVQSREPVAPPPVPVLPAHVRVKPMSV